MTFFFIIFVTLKENIQIFIVNTRIFGIFSTFL